MWTITTKSILLEKKEGGRRLNPPASFLKFIFIDPVSECHNWQGSKNKAGYGYIGYKGKHWLAHRFIWYITFGHLPPGFHIHHWCENTSCVNVLHLIPVTPKEHIQLTPNSPSYKESQKTACDKGHPLVDPNLYYNPNGKHRECLTCRNERSKQSNLKKALSMGRIPGIANSKKTLCKRGHPLQGDNLYINRKGERQCRECDRIRRKKKREEKIIKFASSKR